MLLRQLPVTGADRLVMLYQRGSHNGSNAAPLAAILCRRLIPPSDAEMVSGNWVWVSHWFDQ
jgi:hypothetical protein